MNAWKILIILVAAMNAACVPTYSSVFKIEGKVDGDPTASTPEVDPDAPAVPETPTLANFSGDCAVVVDAKNGLDPSDKNAGCPTSALNSIAGVNAVLAQKSLTRIGVFFTRGQKWVGKLDLPPKDIVISATGPGDYPKIGAPAESNAMRITAHDGNHFIIDGLNMYAPNPVHTAFVAGVDISADGGQITIHDSIVNGFYHNIGAQPPGASLGRLEFLILSSVKILNARSAVYNFTSTNYATKVAYPNSYASTSGIYIDGAKTLLITDSMFANNGNQIDAEKRKPHFSYYNHQIYLSSDNRWAPLTSIEHAILRRNILVATFPKIPGWWEAGTQTTKDFSATQSTWPNGQTGEGPDGIKNFSDNTRAHDNYFSGLQQPAFAKFGVVEFFDNVITNPVPLSGCPADVAKDVCEDRWGASTLQQPRLGALNIGSDTIDKESLFEGNLFVHSRFSVNPFWLTNFTGLAANGSPQVDKNIVFDWVGDIQMSNTCTGVTAANFAQYNDLRLPGSGYVDAQRSIASVAGVGSDAALVAAVLQQAPSTWATALTSTSINKFIRDGFSQR